LMDGKRGATLADTRAAAQNLIFISVSPYLGVHFN